jgi:hypothetical protein
MRLPITARSEVGVSLEAFARNAAAIILCELQPASQVPDIMRSCAIEGEV